MKRENRRGYIRVSTVLPVEFFLADKHGKKITPWIQGFTHDICKGGICLIANDLWWGFWDKFNQPESKIFLRINLPFKREPLFLEADIRWKETERLKKFSQYRIGLEFIGPKKKKAGPIFRFAVIKKVIPAVVVSILAGFALVASFLFWKTKDLAEENRRLVSGYVEILQRNSFLA